MKHLVALTLAMVCCLSFSWAQLNPLSSVNYATEAPEGYWLEIVHVTDHESGTLAGQSTYRIYLQCLDATDYLSSCSGDAENPMIFESSTGTWYNNEMNAGWNAMGINPLFLGVFPDLAYDSFLTIGAMDSTTPAAQHPSAVWGDIDATEQFVPGIGNSVTVNDATGGAWYTPFPGLASASTHAAFAGDDLKIMVAQFTSAGTISGQIQIQVFMNGDQGQEWRDVLPICTYADCFGCLDPAASNYNGEAVYDSGDCEYIVDVEGCTDETACNYNMDATVDDASCTYAEENYDCEGNCINEDALGVCGGDCAADADADGICDDVDDCVGAVDACGVCNGPGEIYACGCTDIPAGDCDCDGNQLDALGACGGDCAADADADGICDDVDDCVGALDACGVCNGPGEIYACGCTEIPAGDCDCDGNQLDALGACGGDCATDADADGICDDVDDCVGTLDACGICNGPGAVLECGCTDIPEGACDCDGNQLDALGVCGGDCAADTDADGICDDVDDCIGTLDACGICNGPGEIYACGCDDIPAGACDCNGNQLDVLGVCGGDCAADADADGICDDEDDCIGALDACGVCNGPGEIYACGCADIPDGDCDCDGNQIDALGICGGGCAADADADGICDDVDDCVGVLDVCGICNGLGAIYDCGCSDIPEGDCDCDGNQLDNCGICGGQNECACEEDLDADGICDDVDDCVGSSDACGVCNGDATCDLNASSFAGMELLLSSSCSSDDLPFGLADQITLTLGGSGNIVAHNGASNIIVGTWELNACACATELTFFDLDCGSIDLGVGEGGLIAQVSAADDCCLSVTDPADTWCSTEFLASLTDQTVQCPEDLPTDCDPIIQGEDVCSDNLFLCSFSQAEEGYLTHLVTTAEGPGADAVIRIYGLSAQSVCLSDYFVEDPLAPLELIRYPETGTARLVGSVHNDLDPSMTFDVDMYFNAEQPAEEWLAEGAGHSLLTSWACDVDPANITLYNMTNTISRMTGTGSLQGEIYLNHMPISYNKRFQLGEGANNHNCEYGFGGWFGWHGIVDGMSVMGFSGDVIADLSAPTSTETFCGGEFAQITYASIDLGTGQSTYTTQTWTVEDTQAPEFVDANELAPSYTIEWSALHDEACGWNIEVPCLTTTDNCGDWNPQYEGCNEPENACGEVIFSEQIIEGDCAGEFTVIRLWQAIDGSGNMSTHQQVIMVEDTEGPDFTGTPYESTNACDDITVMDYVANDCSGVTSVWFEQTLQSGTCSNPGSISRTYHAVDGCGNESTFIQILNVTDEDAPVILTPDATVDCHAYSADEPYGHDVEDCDLRVWTEEDGQWTSTFNDNWSNEGDGLDTPVIVSWTDSAPVYNGNGESCYIVTRTLTASDNCGNTSTATQTIFLSDTTAPVLAASAVINIEHDIYEGNGSMLVTPAMAGLLLGGDQAQFQVTDNCSSDFGNDILVTWTDEATAEETCLQLEGGTVFIRTYSALDACGNTSTLTQEVVLVDTTAPTWSNSGETTDAVDCEEATLELMSNPNYMPLTGGVFDSGDADLDIELTATLMSGGCIGVWLRSWSATDDCGNTSYADQYVAMFDSMDPEFTSVPADMTIPLTEACSFNLAVEATGGVPAVYDNCELCLDQDLDVTYTNSEPTYLCGGEGGSFVIERTWSVTDHCGNTTTHVQTLTFTDVTAPVFNETLPGDLAVDCEAPDADVLTATDACAGDVEVIFEEEVTAQTCPNTYTLVRTWTATDLCGNTTSHTQTISVSDDEAPTGTASTPDVSCSEYNGNPDQMFGEIIANDNCGGEVQISFDVTEDEVLTMDTENQPSEDGCIQIRRTYTLVDLCGNTSELIQTINLIDTTPPEYVGPMQVSIPAHEYDVDGNYPPDSPWDIIDGTGIVPIWYVDDCSGMDTCIIQDLPLSGGCANQPHPEFYGETATYLRTMTVWDNCGNMSMAEIIITLIDDIEPVFVGVPADYTVSCVGDVIYDDPVVTDLTDESVNVEETVEIVGQSCANSYQIVRTWVATDNCDNEATATQTITISDDIAPELTIPADYTAECSDEHPMDAAAATDNCGDVTVEETLVTLPGACAGDYIMERTFTATDACGNSTSATQVITIIDTTAPEFTSVPADYTAECSDEHPLDAASASDNCGDVTITVVADTTAGNCTGSYTVVRTFTATDDCGNASSATQTITIIDTTAPVLTIPADYTAECSDEHPLGDASAVDNCGDVTITLVTDTTSGSCPQAYYVARTFTAVDDCGNTSSATQTITIVDTTAPVIDAQDAMSISCDTYSADDAYGTAADNCGSTTLTWDDTAVSGGCTMPVGTYMRLYTAVDECGNVSTFEQVITLVDDTAPVFDFVPADYTAECDQTLLFEDVMASDNCSGVDVTEQRDTIAGDCPHAFTIVRTFTAIDNCDNVSSATQTIEVVDTTAPMLTIPADYTAECSADHPLNDASAYDNCGEVSLVMVVDTLAGDCSQSYTVTRTFTATDECGNSDTQVQTITIVDTTAPAFNESLPADATVECDAVPAADILTASDNCQAVSVQFEEAIQGGACPQTYTITRTWTVSDDCGNTSSHIQTLEVQDTTAPQLTIPADYTAECSEDHPLDAATAQDNCGIVTLEEVADTSFTCDHTYTVTRTFTATDECGNSTSASQIITIQDTTAPAFVEALPGDATVECDDVPAADVLTATDNCDAVEVSFEESIAEGDCPQQYTITRMWTVADACGNETSHTQTIEVVDTTAPNFTSTGELVNNEVVSVGYDDNFGSVTLPSLVDVTASDNCDEPVSCSDEATANANAELSAALGLEFNFDYLVNVDASGINNPFITGGAYTQGAIANPAVMADGETCDNNDVAHGVRMFNFMGGEYFITESGTATVDASGVHVVMTARNVADDDGILHVDAQFASLMTWQEWLDTPGNESFKSDCGLGNHEEWLYTVLTSGTITGEGSLAGTSLSLMHQPMNEYFGFQFGEGANNKNGNFGFSGWYYYSGTLSLNGNQSNVMGSGDLFGDLDFLQDWSTTLEYCVTDCAGNENTFSYTISSTGMIVNPLDEGGVQEGEDEFMVTAKDLISIQTLYPNPTSGQTSLVLESQEDVTATVSLFDMSGNLVMEIYQGMLYEDWSMNLTIDAQTLEAGMYQIQIHSKQFVTTKKLLVTE